jgi:hypothetical protein
MTLRSENSRKGERRPTSGMAPSHVSQAPSRDSRAPGSHASGPHASGSHHSGSTTITTTEESDRTSSSRRSSTGESTKTKKTVASQNTHDRVVQALNRPDSPTPKPTLYKYTIKKHSGRIRDTKKILQSLNYSPRHPKHPKN